MVEKQILLMNLNLFIQVGVREKSLQTLGHSGVYPTLMATPLQGSHTEKHTTTVNHIHANTILELSIISGKLEPGENPHGHRENMRSPHGNTNLPNRSARKPWLSLFNCVTGLNHA